MHRTTSRRLVCAIVGLLATLGASSCRYASMDDYRAAVKSGAQHLPYAVEMERIYGKADHFITHYGGGESPLIWNTEVHTEGRIVLTMQVDVTVDHSTHRVTGVAGDPVFYVNVVSRVIVHQNGTTEAEFDTESATRFGKEEWASVEDAGGDLSVVGVQAGPPVPSFDVFESQVRAPRIPVSLVDGSIK